MSTRYILVIGLLIITNCSTRDMYTSIQANQKIECAKGLDSEYDGCMKKANMSYEEYEKERQKIMK